MATKTLSRHGAVNFWHHIRLVPLFSSILGGILVLFALCIALASYFLIQSDKALQDVTEEIHVRMGLSDSSSHLHTARLNIIHAGSAVRVGEMDDMRLNIAEAEKRIKQAQEGFNAYMERRVKTPADEALDADLRARFEAYISQGMLPMIKFAKNGMFEAIIKHEDEAARKLDADYNAVMLKAVAIRTERATALTAEAQARTRLSVIIMAGAFAVALFMTIFTFVLLRRVVIGPLQQAASRIEHIAEGDLTLAQQPCGRSEIGKLSQHLQDMQSALVKTVGSVREGAEAIYQGTSEISAGNTDLSSRTEEQAAALEQTAASMEQLTATVKQNADNAHHASKLAEDASKKASDGGRIVSGVVKTMSNISTSSKKISEITAVINSIAFQTNILALNAAVEAARAGEQGRGFAVVASEVRTLAQRSAQAAKEIEGLISESVSLIDSGSEQVVHAGETMNGLVDAVRRVTDIMLEIAAASDEQSRGIQQVGQAINEMDNVTQQNASLVEEASAAAVSLEEQAARLTAAVGIFRMHSHAQAPKPAAAKVMKFKPAAAAESDDNWATF
ncbi:methyl-accepting chemotaxis protein [Dryocola sp. BD586]|jgi:methyl-accepting chemotaxis protein-3 (ribose and galactose sensor receptor)|uniref:methyl-accepting chemotaxis protein n=1 Tax=Dryocola sp. BD586 TaxID=3133271 RepID=UPI003F4F7A5E